MERAIMSRVPPSVATLRELWSQETCAGVASPSDAVARAPASAATAWLWLAMIPTPSSPSVARLRSQS
eukprot:1294374-Prymnesium_polylepis.1